MTADAREASFQEDVIRQMIAGGWQLGAPYNYNREQGLYPSDCLDYVQRTQPKAWAKYEKLYPNNPE